MSAFIMNDITDGGLSALAYALTGEELRFTKIIIGSGYMPEGATPRSMETVVTPEATLDIIKKTIGADPSTVVIGGAFTNKDTSAAFYYRELALYAETDSTGEVLYCYGNAGDCAELIPAGGAGNVIEKVIDVTAAIGGAANVTAHINLEAYATVRQMEEAIEAAEMKTDPEVKIDLEKIKVDVAKIEVDTKEIKDNTEDIKLDLEGVEKSVAEVKDDVAGVSANIGKMDDTGGTARSGSLNAKANAVIEKWGDMDGDILEEKLNEMLGYGPKYVPSDTVQVNLYKTALTIPAGSDTADNVTWAVHVLFNMVAEHDGNVRIKYTIPKMTTSHRELTFFISRSDIPIHYSADTNAAVNLNRVGNADLTNVAYAPTGTVILNMQLENTFIPFHALWVNYWNIVQNAPTGGIPERNIDVVVPVKKGETLYVITQRSGAAFQIQNLQVLYDIKEAIV